MMLGTIKIGKPSKNDMHRMWLFIGLGNLSRLEVERHILKSQ